MRKQILLTIVFLLMSMHSAVAQFIDNKPISELDIDYIKIKAEAKLFAKKLSISIDYGQEKVEELKDLSGNPNQFNSMIDALNFMSKNGYDFISIDNEKIGDTQYLYRYIMKKRKQ
ncbi:hypothetical protein [Flavobacterium sp. DSR2-3-3]|uniref:hypothetical protein n=1 Tax=Flavobacterium sp. DSR2-3-3 TaxID=2804632 RepID=UPI003CF2A94C